MMELTPELCKLLEPALSLLDEGGARRSGKPRTASASQSRILARRKPHPGQKCGSAISRSCQKAFHAQAAADQDAAFDWYRERSPLPL
jgi:hypothetical protein